MLRGRLPRWDPRPSHLGCRRASQGFWIEIFGQFSQNSYQTAPTVALAAYSINQGSLHQQRYPGVIFFALLQMRVLVIQVLD